MKGKFNHKAIYLSIIRLYINDKAIYMNDKAIYDKAIYLY